MSHARLTSTILAGLAGSGTLLAAGRFDREYAPRTVARRDHPGTAAGASVVCLALGAVLYGSVRNQNRSPLYGGVALGLVVYLMSAVGLLPAARLGPAAWKQTFPQVCGALLRHVIAGVATAAVFRATSL